MTPATEDTVTYDQWKTSAPSISPEEEREMEARLECERRGLDPDEICADGGVTAWMVVDKEVRERMPLPPRHAWPADGEDPF